MDDLSITHCYFCKSELSDISNYNATCKNCPLEIRHYFFLSKNYTRCPKYLSWIGIVINLNDFEYEIYINIESNGNPSDYKFEISKYKLNSTHSIILQSNANINFSPQNAESKLISLLNLIPFS